MGLHSLTFLQRCSEEIQFQEMNVFSEIDSIANIYNRAFRKLMWYFTGFAKLFFDDKVALQFLASLFKVFSVFKN